ncbi:MAG TPA: ATP synthase F1 subunit gamma [Ignavibacteriaceae bacterium]|nr:ATP synthase F1 subunit gamma [Ignavibacteriaceae bacterium]
MATLRDIKTRISSVQNIQKITNAMKMVAAAKLRRAQENVINARPYAKKISVLLSHLVTENDINNNPFITPRKVENVAVVTFSADRGLCGAFNTNIIKETVRYINKELKPENINAHLFCIGKIGFSFFNKRNYTIFGKRIGLFSSLNYNQVQAITNELIPGYLEGKYDKVILIFNEFKSVISQKIVIEQFLPVPINSESEENENKGDYIFEPDQQSIFNFLLPKQLRAQIWRALLESNAAELGAKMTAMDNATTNAKEMIRTLKIKFNKERQAAITKEILEIVSGANALKAE